MSDTMDPMATDVDQQELAQQLLAQAREQGIDLVGRQLAGRARFESSSAIKSTAGRIRFPPPSWM